MANDIVSEIDTVRHLSPMLSLANSYNLEDLKDFDKQIKKLLLSQLRALNARIASKQKILKSKKQTTDKKLNKSKQTSLTKLI